jgi:hypothetical protein
MDPIPMSFANIPAQADTRTPLSVNAPPFVDTIGQAARAYKLADVMMDTDQKRQEAQDQQIVQQALQEGANLNTPDGVKSAADSLKGKISARGYQALIDRQGVLEERASKAQERLASLDETKLGLMQKQTDITLKSLSGLLSEYDDTAKEKGLDVALNEFNAKKQATIKALVESGMVKPQVAEQMASLSPTALKTTLETSKFWQDQMKAAADLKEKNARAAKEEAQAKAVEQGGASVAMLQTVEERYGKDSPEYKAALQRVSNLRTANAGDGGKLDDATLTAMAEQYLAGDRTVFQNLGRGAQGAENVVALRKKAVELAAQRGMKGSDVAQIVAEFEGLKASERTLGNRAATVGMAVNEADKLSDLALKASEQWKRSGIKSLNDLQKAAQSATASPELRQFAAANLSFINAYARAIAPTGVPTQSDKDHAREILDVAFSKGDYRAAIDQLKREMQAAKEAPAATKAELRKLSESGSDDHPRVDPKEQAKRDSDARAILTEELSKAQKRKEELDKDPNATPEAKQRNDEDIAGIQRELKRAGGQVPPTNPEPKPTSIAKTAGVSERAVLKYWPKYEPDKYDYRVNPETGEVERKKRGA